MTAKAPHGRERRGVLMTATSRKRGSWKDLQEDVEIGDSDNEGDGERKASQNEWAALEKQVEKEVRTKELASGIRRSALVAYEDVAGDEEDEDLPSAPSSPESPPAAEGAAAGEAVAGAQTAEDARVVPEGVSTAGEQKKEKKRGGEKRTGASRRKNKAGEDGPPPKKKKEEEDPDRWLKMRLEGEEKVKRIDATRVVHYHDFDGSSVAAPALPPAAEPEAPASAASSSAAPRSFRAGLRRDLFDSDDDE